MLLAEKLNPSNVNTRLNLGTLYQAQKEYETAIAAYDTILDVNPNFKLAYLYKAQCYKALGNKDAALENYKLALNLDPNNFQIKNEISSLYEENMTPEEKLAHYYAQIQKNPTDEELVYNALEDIAVIIQDGPRYGIFNFVVYDTVYPIRNNRMIKIDNFRHKIAFPMGKDECGDYLGRSNLLDGLEKQNGVVAYMMEKEK